jgi:Tetratricopeptide repeat
MPLTQRRLSGVDPAENRVAEVDVRLALISAIWRRPDVTRVVLRFHAEASKRMKPQVDLRLVVAGSEGEASRSIAESVGACYVEVPNSPLGAKWNAAAEAARDLDVDGVVVCGSDDLLSEAYLRWCADGVREGFEYQGILDLYYMHLATGRVIHWPGYSKGTSRRGEPAGTGRCLSRVILDRLRFRPWDDALERLLDRSMTEKVRELHSLSHRCAKTYEAGPVLALHGPTALSDFGQLARTPGVVPANPRIIRSEFGSKVEEDVHHLRRKVDHPIGASLVVKGNETARLGACLDSISAHVDEIVIRIDTRFGDQARQTIKDHAPDAVVVCGTPPLYMEADETPDGTSRIDFAKARNECLDLLSPRIHWAFIIDADEILARAGDLRNAVARAVDSGQQGLFVRVDTISKGEVSDTGLQIRLLDREKVRWKYPVHNQLEGVSATGLTDTIIRSYYDHESEGRFERSTPMLEKLWNEAQSDVERRHAAYFLAQMYYAHRKVDKAIEWARICRDLMPNDAVRAPFWRWLALAHAQRGELDEAEDVVTEGLRRHPRFIDLWHVRVAVDLWRFQRSASAREHQLTRSVAKKHLPRVEFALRELGLPLKPGQE